MQPNTDLKSWDIAAEVLELLRTMPDFQAYNCLRDSRYLEITVVNARDFDKMSQLKTTLQRLAEIAYELKKE